MKGGGEGGLIGLGLFVGVGGGVCVGMGAYSVFVFIVNACSVVLFFFNMYFFLHVLAYS